MYSSTMRTLASSELAFTPSTRFDDGPVTELNTVSSAPCAYDVRSPPCVATGPEGRKPAAFDNLPTLLIVTQAVSIMCAIALQRQTVDG